MDWRLKVKPITAMAVLGIALSLLVSLLTVRFDIFGPLFVIGISVTSVYLAFLFRYPPLGMLTVLGSCFLLTMLGRELGGLNYSGLMEAVLVVTFFAALYYYRKEDWAIVWNDLTFLMLCWFVISVMELLNPRANFSGGIRELRGVAVYPMLVVPIALLILRKVKLLDHAIVIILVFSVIAALNGIRQHMGILSPGEQRFLDSGGSITHLLWGKLRVFSIYSDAGQFGASQAQIGLVALILAFGPFKWWKRVLLFSAALLMLYGMLISGTRGALFALVTGAVVAIFLTKNFKAMAVSGVALVMVLGLLKFTTIGNSNYEIYRLRSALDPTDASLNVRFNSQAVLSDYLSDKPFGDGLGTIGYFGMEYNQGTFLSTVQPDSYWVKVWAMYGIVGLTIWLCMMLYILGKCCGIVWNIQDRGLKVKLMALTAGFAGAFFCSYGNEVINSQPTSIIVYVSWALIFWGPAFDKELKMSKSLTGN